MSAPPSGWDVFADRLFRMLAQAAAGAILLLLAFILWEIGIKAGPGIRDYGVGFLTSSTWDVSRGQFGILPAIWGHALQLPPRARHRRLLRRRHGHLPHPGLPPAADG